MTLAEAIAVAMMTLPCPADEPADQCQPWRAQVAEAIEQAAQEATCTHETAGPDCRPLYSGAADELAAALTEIADHESGLRRRIQAGRCNDDECDAVKHRKTGRWTGRHLARSLWQLHASPTIPGVVSDVPRDDWLASVGTSHEHLMVAARAATRLFVHSPSAFGRAAKTGKRAQAAARILSRIREASRGASE